MKFIGIREKLLALVTEALILIVATLVVLLIIAGSIYVRTEMRAIEESMRSGIISKGMVLIGNNSTALRGMVQDNAFLAVRELVSSTVQDDPDIAYGVFMDNERRPWALYHTDSATAEFADNQILNDSLSLWADTIKTATYRQCTGVAQNSIEFAASVMSESERVGTIRYGITINKMQQAIAERKKSVYTLAIIFAGGTLAILLFMLGLGSWRARRQARAITEPIARLREAAGRISQGDYSAEVTVCTNDEVGELALSFENMRTTIKAYTDNLESMVQQRTAELEEAHRELVEKAHKAGMADIATGTLHNVGNILNSVLTSVHLLGDILDRRAIDGLSKANQMLSANLGDLEQFILRDPKGPRLMQYYIKLEDVFNQEREQIRQQLERLSDKVNTITDVIAAQQNYAGAASLTETLNLEGTIEDALTMQSGSIEKYQIRIERQFGNVSTVKGQKTKLIHILINLIKNAKEAMTDVDPAGRILKVATWMDQTGVHASIGDTGPGIPSEISSKIFAHGFTTKDRGHGFGLHSCANYMTEMQGEIRVENQGQGATFVLTFPRS